MIEFLRMGGYAAFVWPAYGIVAVVMAANVLVPWWRHRQLRRRLRAGGEA